MGYSDDKSTQRISLNLRIDPDKHVMLEEFRTSGFGFATTVRNRSDVYNEALGFGIQTLMLRKQLGDREFDQLWKIINNMNLRKLNLDKIAELFTGQE
jgi:hypothetical protein